MNVEMYDPTQLQYFMFLSKNSKKLVAASEVPAPIRVLIDPKWGGRHMWDPVVRAYVIGLPEYDGESPDPRRTHYSTWLE